MENEPMTTDNKEVQVKEENLPAALMDEMFEDAGVGQEEMTADDMQIPRLVILQSLSPQCIKTEGEYIDGAEAGMIMDSVTQKLIDGDKGILIVSCSYRKTVIEWKLRENNGGGFVEDHGNHPELVTVCEKDIKNRMINKDGNEMKPTLEYYVFIIDAETGEANPALLSMSSTQIKAGKRWNTLMNQLKIKGPNGKMFNPASFYRSYKFQTVPQTNEHGSWFGWKITGDIETVKLPDGEDLYRAAKSFREQVASGAVKVHEDKQEGSNIESEDDPM